VNQTLAGRLLVVEDEEHLAFSLQFNFEAEGYAVTVATCLRDARGHLADASYDLIVLDMMLPDGLGIDLCRELRVGGDHTPVLFLTAKGAPDDVVAGLDAGADDYVTKPFVLVELLTRVAAMLRRQRWNDSAPAAGGVDVFEFGSGNRVDFSTHEATAHGQPVSLTDLELRLLRFFSERQSLVVSRQELLEDVWGLAGDTNTRTVDNFLVRLRRLFEVDPSRPAHFVTVRGVGYRFVP
jgi:two-component system, OmpR family, alkaline phosphatase synthesis response regulator PhoP